MYEVKKKEREGKKKEMQNISILLKQLLMLGKLSN